MVTPTLRETERPVSGWGTGDGRTGIVELGSVGRAAAGVPCRFYSSGPMELSYYLCVGFGIAILRIPEPDATP